MHDWSQVSCSVGVYYQAANWYDYDLMSVMLSQIHVGHRCTQCRCMLILVTCIVYVQSCNTNTNNSYTTPPHHATCNNRPIKTNKNILQINILQININSISNKYEKFEQLVHTTQHHQSRKDKIHNNIQSIKHIDLHDYLHRHNF